MTSVAPELVTLLIPVMNEVRSLTETLRIIREENADRRLEYLILLSPRSQPEAVANAERLRDEDPEHVRTVVQRLPMLGGALITGFEDARGSRVVVMASDLETDPHLIPELLRVSDANPRTIVATTRWRGAGAGFEGYRAWKQIANKIFQWGISALYRNRLSDWTFGYRLYPAEAVRGVEWTCRDFGFLIECVLRPMKAGWRVIEIPTYWKPRDEGESNNSWTYYASYFRIALQLRFGR